MADLAPWPVAAASLVKLEVKTVIVSLQPIDFGVKSICHLLFSRETPFVDNFVAFNSAQCGRQQ